MMITMRAENKLAYYDRIVNLDAVAVYAEIVEVPNSGALPLRYKAVHVNLLRSASQVYTSPTNYTVDTGDVTTTGITAGTRLVCHYLTHPSWRIVEHPHNVRLTQVKSKTADPLTPSGDPSDLPVQPMLCPGSSSWTVDVMLAPFAFHRKVVPRASSPSTVTDETPGCHSAQSSISACTAHTSSDGAPTNVSSRAVIAAP